LAYAGLFLGDHSYLIGFDSLILFMIKLLIFQKKWKESPKLPQVLKI